MMAGDFFRLPDRKDVILVEILFDASSPIRPKECENLAGSSEILETEDDGGIGWHCLNKFVRFKKAGVLDFRFVP